MLCLIATTVKTHLLYNTYVTDALAFANNSMTESKQIAELEVDTSAYTVKEIVGGLAEHEYAPGLKGEDIGYLPR